MDRGGRPATRRTTRSQAQKSPLAALKTPPPRKRGGTRKNTQKTTRKAKEPAKSTEPAEPVELTEPTEPTEPTESTELTESTEPTESIEPTEPRVEESTTARENTQSTSAATRAHSPSDQLIFCEESETVQPTQHAQHAQTAPLAPIASTASATQTAQPPPEVAQDTPAAATSPRPVSDPSVSPFNAVDEPVSGQSLQSSSLAPSSEPPVATAEVIERSTQASPCPVSISQQVTLPAPATRDIAIQTLRTALSGEELLPLTPEEIRLVTNHRLAKRSTAVGPTPPPEPSQHPPPRSSADSVNDPSISAHVDPLPTSRKRSLPTDDAETDDNGDRRTRPKITDIVHASAKKRDRDIRRGRRPVTGLLRNNRAMRLKRAAADRDKSLNTKPDTAEASETNPNSSSMPQGTEDTPSSVPKEEKEKPLESLVRPGINLQQPPGYIPRNRRHVSIDELARQRHERWLNRGNAQERAVRSSDESDDGDEVTERPQVGAFPEEPVRSPNVGRRAPAVTQQELVLTQQQTPARSGWSFGTLTSSISRVFQFTAGDNRQRRQIQESQTEPSTPEADQAPPQTPAAHHATLQAPQTMPHPKPDVVVPDAPATAGRPRRRKEKTTKQPKPQKKPLYGSREHRVWRNQMIKKRQQEAAEYETAKANYIIAIEDCALTARVRSRYRARRRELGDSRADATFELLYSSSSSSEGEEDPAASQPVKAGSVRPASAMGGRLEASPAKRARLTETTSAEPPLRPVYRGPPPLRRLIDPHELNLRIGAPLMSRRNILAPSSPDPAKSKKKEFTLEGWVDKHSYKRPPDGSFGFVYGSSSSSDEDDDDENEEIEGISSDQIKVHGSATSTSPAQTGNIFAQAAQQNSDSPSTSKASFENSLKKGKGRADDAHEQPGGAGSASSSTWTQPPPDRPQPPHAELPGGSSEPSSEQTEASKAGEESSDAVGKARLQAEKYKPKTPSGLRATSRLSTTSTVLSETNDDTQALVQPSDQILQAGALSQIEQIQSGALQLASEEALDPDVQAQLALEAAPESQLTMDWGFSGLQDFDPAEFDIDPEVWQVASAQHEANWPQERESAIAHFMDEFEEWNAARQLPALTY